MIAKGAVAALVTAIVALLVRMRDLNLELMRKLASKSKKRPPNEAMRRLQMELPLICALAANDTKPAPVDDKRPKKRGPKKPTPHGRPLLPAHIPRVPNVLLVPDARRKCPRCDVEVARICIKTTAEKLDVEPSKFCRLANAGRDVRLSALPSVRRDSAHARRGRRSRHPRRRVARSGTGRPLPRRRALGADGAQRPPRGRSSGSQHAGVFRRQAHRSVRPDRRPYPRALLVLGLLRARRHTHARARSAPPARHQERRALPGSSKATTATPASCTPRARTPTTSRSSSRDAPSAA